MNIRWLIEKLILCWTVLVVVCVLVIDSVFLTAAETFKGYLIGICVATLSITPLLFYFTQRFGKNIFWLRIIQIAFLGCICILVYVVASAPSGNNKTSPITHEYISGAQFNRMELFNIIPEIDQISFGLSIVSFFDSQITRQEIDHVKKLTRNIYSQLNDSKEFNQLGSVLGLCYADILGGPFNPGHYYLYVPKKHQNKTIPVIIFLHGSLGNFKSYYWVLSKLAEEKGIAIIAPSYGAGNWRHDDSMNLIRASLKDASRKVNIDQDNIFLSSISNGGLGVTRLAFEHPQLFKGLIYLSPVFDFSIMDRPSFSKKWSGKSILVISGESDNRIPLQYLKESTSILLNQGVRVEEVYYKNEDHFLLFSQPESVLKDIGVWMDRQFDL